MNNTEPSSRSSSTTKNLVVVRVDITSDLLCPWCWVGLRKLQEARKQLQQQHQQQQRAPEEESGGGEKLLDIEIHWQPYMLRPNTPVEGTLKEDTIPEKRVGKHLKAAGQSVGIDFTGLTDRVPNTSLFHATIHYLQEKNTKEELNITWESITAFHEAVFEAYFTLGIFPDEAGILQAANKSVTKYYPNGEVAQRTRIVDAIQKLYEDQYQLNKLQDVVKEEALIASYRRDVRGVPTFAFNGEVAFSGAQPVSTFVAALKAAAAQENELSVD